MSAIAHALDNAITTKISRGQKAAATRKANEAQASQAALSAALANQARIEALRTQEANATKEEVDAIVNAKPDANIALLQALHNAIVADFVSDNAVKEAFIAAGKDQTDVIRQFYASRLVAVGACATLERARLVVKPAKEGGLKACPKAGVEVTDAHMTHKEELGFVAARGYLTQKRKAWGIPTTSNQGGDRTKAAGEETPMDVEKVNVPSRKGIVTDLELAAYLMASATSHYALCLNNSDHEAVTTDLGSELMGACADFEAAIKDVLAKHDVK